MNLTIVVLSIGIPDGDFCGPQRLYAHAWASATDDVDKPPVYLTLFIDGLSVNSAYDKAEVWEDFPLHLKPNQRLQACLRYGGPGDTYLRMKIIMNPLP